MNCNICPRKCNIDRKTSVGFCKSPDEFRLARASLHFWEEPCISGKNGSGAVFFSGCNLKCKFCQNYEISNMNKGIIISDDKLIEIFENLIAQGANNINLVNPTHYAPRLANVLKRWNSPVPIIYNSSGYESVETLKLLDGLVDVYLPDLKYIRDDKAKLYSGAENYFEVATKAIDEMVRQQSKNVYDNGIIQKGVIIRHLILPQNTNSTLRIIDYVKNNYQSAMLSIMAQYTPCGDVAKIPELQRKITKREYQKVLQYIFDLGIKNVYIQEMQSADKKYIPTFDFSGIL